MKKNFFLICIIILTLGCSEEKLIVDDKEIIEEVDENLPENLPDSNTNSQKNFKLLSLGDSYTIGESVCETCRFPEQLKDSLKLKFNADNTFSLKIIARTGWTTTNLINAIKAENLETNYDLVTLLIGVNNQFQGIPFNIYQSEFINLIDTATSLAKGDKSNLIVVSIPDYAFTPFGRGNTNISTDIDKYNDYAKNYCTATNITYVNITDITRMGLQNTALVASDGLHPSTLAYSKFVERILPFAISKLKD